MNAFRCFQKNLSETKVIPVAGTVSPSKCTHCRKLNKLLLARTCPKDKWRCKCAQCKEVRGVWKAECESGTSEEGVLRALKHFGGSSFEAHAYESGSEEHAWQWLHGSLIHGRVAILCLDRWTHWSLAFGTAGDIVNVFDSYPSKVNLKQNGVHPLIKKELMRRWKNGNKTVGKEKRLYAISVGRR